MIARVFPRRTAATPRDAFAFTGPPGLFPPHVGEVHVSVTFTWDLPRAEQLAREWERIAPVKIGGPATGMAGAEFTPGVYTRLGYVITSRGCPNHCTFCLVPAREGSEVRELAIQEGYNVLDDNLLACSRSHVLGVIDMLCRQKMGRPEFTGGLEARRLEPWSALAIRSVRPKQVFFAYDTPQAFGELQRAVELCWEVGFTPQAHRIRAYVLCGYYAWDTVELAEARMKQVLSLGVLPMAMLWRHTDGSTMAHWPPFQRRWARPAIMASAEAR